LKTATPKTVIDKEKKFVSHRTEVREEGGESGRTRFQRFINKEKDKTTTKEKRESRHGQSQVRRNKGAGPQRSNTNTREESRGGEKK